MKTAGKIITAFLAAAMTAPLLACGSSGKAQQPSETAVQTEKSETPEEALPEPSEAVAEYLEPADSAAPGHFSDPEAFTGFDSYHGKYYLKGEYYERDVVFGETILKDHYSEKISQTKQYADGSHNSIDNPETLEAGAVGLAVTGSFNGIGDEVAFVVYNPSESPAAFGDCVIIGFENTHAEWLVFSNDASFSMPWVNARKEDPREAVIAALGEPFEADGEISDSSDMASYCWRDESGKHVLRADIWGSEGHFQTVKISYKNFEFAGE